MIVSLRYFLEDTFAITLLNMLTSHPWQKPHAWLGHKLIWLFTCSISPFHPYDHFPTFTKLSTNPTPLPRPTLHCFRRLHCIDIGSFLTNLKSSRLITHPPNQLTLPIAYITTLSSLLDKHAPIITKLTTPQSPFNLWSTSSLCAFRSTVLKTFQNPTASSPNSTPSCNILISHRSPHTSVKNRWC